MLELSIAAKKFYSIGRQHDYAVIVYKHDKKNDDDSIEIYSTVCHKNEDRTAPFKTEKKELQVVAQVHQVQNLETSTDVEDDVSSEIYGVIWTFIQTTFYLTKNCWNRVYLLPGHHLLFNCNFKDLTL